MRETKAVTVSANPTVADDDLVLDDDQPILEKLGLDLSPAQWVKLVIHLLICVMGVVGLKVYEIINLEQLTVRQNTLQTDLTKLNEQKEQIKKDLEVYDSLKDQSDQLHATIVIIQSIVDNRELAVRGLDQIQHAVPDKLWLNKISYSDKKFLIDGIGVNNKEIEKFVEKLEETNIFEKVHLTQIRESTQSTTGIPGQVFTLESIIRK